ncbi:MAG: cytochrome b [Alphaproteobacteria bacterium]|nr:cytochrome b [Alphaproteobacteria bacterium]
MAGHDDEHLLHNEIKLLGVLGWVEYRLPIFNWINNAVGTNYPTPKNVNYFWNFGSLAGIALVIQILTGIVLAAHYVPTADGAFASVERIMRDVNYGWLFRYAHANGASLFFAVVYIHLFRNLYYGSYKYPRELLWWLGLIMLILMITTAFMGYVLPWGQMSYWGATVITNLFGAMPIIGDELLLWLWGGFTVGEVLLRGFYSLHYLLAFVIAGLAIVHIWALHQHRSNNPLGIDIKGPQDILPFHPYFTVKDLFGFGIYLIVFALLVFYAPNMLGEPDNYIPADPLQTPAHIVPEWYLLPFYAILRAVPDKLGGVIALALALLVLFAVPWLDTSKVRSARFRPIYKQLFWIFLADVLILGWVGGSPPEGMFITIGQLATVYYFVHFLVLLPIVGKLESPTPLPDSIATAVLEENKRKKARKLPQVGVAPSASHGASSGGGH